MRMKDGMCWPLSLRSSGAVAAAQTARRAYAGEQVNAMSKQRHLLLIAGLLLMTAPAARRQVSTAKAGEPVRAASVHDQTFREWSHDSKADGKPISSRSAGRRPFANALPGRQHAADARQEPSSCQCGTRTRTLPFPTPHKPGPAGARQPAGQAGRERSASRLHCDAPLTGLDESTYGNHLSLSKQGAPRRFGNGGRSGLPASGSKADGRGASHPLTSNETAQAAHESSHRGGILVRRSSQELSDEPQLSRTMSTNGDQVTNPPWGPASILELRERPAIIPQDYVQTCVAR